ncbi:NYN domain limkain-b1-type [Penicillium expansum]|nr:NYN domain limkain-b1-type [Penicillium expansum]
MKRLRPGINCQRSKPKYQAKLSDICQLLTQNCLGFDSPSYRYYKLSDLIAASSLFEYCR